MTILVYKELQNRRWWFRQIPGYKPSHQKFMEVLFFISLSTGYDEIIQQTKLTKLMIISPFSKWLKFIKIAKKTLKIVKIAQNLVFWPFFPLFWHSQFFSCNVIWKRIFFLNNLVPILLLSTKNLPHRSNFCKKYDFTSQFSLFLLGDQGALGGVEIWDRDFFHFFYVFQGNIRWFK